MPPAPDPFIHHQALRGKIADPLTSFFRNFKPSHFDQHMKDLGFPADWRFTDDHIRQAHHSFLKDHFDQDIWVFAYGSLMWDPAFLFDEVRRGHISGYARRFCLRDTAVRGSQAAPGLQAALDLGPCCDGLAFRIRQDRVRDETWVLWQREMLADAYTSAFVKVTTAHGPINALTFVANRASDFIRPDLSRADQVCYLATGAGVLGTSLQYIENVATHFAAIGVEDAYIADLLAEVRAYVSTLPTQART